MLIDVDARSRLSSQHRFADGRRRDWSSAARPRGRRARSPPDDHICFVDTRTPRSRDYESTTTSGPENASTRPRDELGKVATSFAMRVCMGAGSAADRVELSDPLRPHSSMSQERMIGTRHWGMCTTNRRGYNPYTRGYI